MAHVYDPALLRVSGPDAGGFLDNLLTRDVGGLAPGGVAYAGLLTPQGKVIADMMVWRDRDEAFLIETAPDRLAALAQRLRLYKLRARLEIADVSAAWRGAALIDPAAPLADLGPAALAARDPRPPVAAARALLPAADAAALAKRLGPATSRESVRAWRLALGVPDLAEDTAPEELFALEALFEELGGVDFHKGCFVGQENVSRMKRRATTRRKLCRIAYDGEAPAFGATVEAGGSPLGDVRTSAGGFALAALRLDRALEAAEKGASPTADGRPIRIAPPDWLLMPAVGGRGGEA
ncbi:MAG: folate-binding protein [Alphaproteobacteria bacterium]|nr:folate-binding protein [Alphaproteobacteria bacterium]